MQNNTVPPVPGEIVGLLKFFRNPDHLTSLLNGTLYCKTPEYYRLSGDEGVSDKNESSAYSYREQRGDKPVSLLINGHPIDDLISLTLHIGNIKDAWLHCWVALRMPDSGEDIRALVSDLNRIRNEFGTHYGFLPRPKFGLFLKTIKTMTDMNILSGLVNYTAANLTWNAGCKSIAYSYQREYRFLVGQCGVTSMQELILTHPGGFRNFILENPPIQIEDKESGHVFFHLSLDECQSDE